MPTPTQLIKHRCFYGLTLTMAFLLGGCGGGGGSSGGSNNTVPPVVVVSSASSAPSDVTKSSASSVAIAVHKTTPDLAFIPKAINTCPDFVEGQITVTLDGKPRYAQLWISDAAKTLNGPLVFYWHATGAVAANEPPWAMGVENIAAIKALGGMVISPVHDPASGDATGAWPWFLTFTPFARDDDVRLADELLACAIEKAGVDMRHIHSMGFSAGAMQAIQMSYRRSGYIASVVSYSGGMLGPPPNQDPSNKVAAMIFHGGASDYGFQAISEDYRNDFQNNGHFAFICNHKLGVAVDPNDSQHIGHSIPFGGSENSAYQFLMDHPFGAYPSPYEKALPASFPSYCEGSTSKAGTSSSVKSSAQSSSQSSQITSVPKGGVATLDGYSPILINNTVGTLTWVPAVHPAFNEAIHLDITSPTGDMWNGHFLLPITRNIAKGDELLIHAWFRKVPVLGDTSSGSITLILDSATANTSSAQIELTTKGEWQEFFVPVTMKEALIADGHFLKFAFGAGTKPQVLELGGIEILNYGVKGASSAAASSAHSASPKAIAAAAAIGRGVNFGNILEGNYEGEWGGGVINDDLIDKAWAAGFKSIRLPVRWSGHAEKVSPFMIDAVFMARVNVVVDKLIAKGFYVVLDMHHYLQLDGDALPLGEVKVEDNVVDERFVNMWGQIATAFKDKSDRLAFELYNEPHGRLKGESWNDLAARALIAVRKTNPDRVVVIGPTSWNSASDLALLKLPNDANLISTIHNYAPFTFTHQGADWVSPSPPIGVTCCNEAQIADMNAPLRSAKAWSIATHFPLFVGEFGSYNKADEASRIAFNHAMRSAIESRGMGWMYWEFSAGFGVYDPVTLTFRQNLLDSLTAN